MEGQRHKKPLTRVAFVYNGPKGYVAHCRGRGHSVAAPLQAVQLVETMKRHDLTTLTFDVTVHVGDVLHPPSYQV